MVGEERPEYKFCHARRTWVTNANKKCSTGNTALKFSEMGEPKDQTSEILSASIFYHQV